MTTTVEILRNARSLIDSPEKWHQGDYGEFGASGEEYCKFCAFGALDASCSRLDAEQMVYSAADRALMAALPIAFQDLSYVTFNDHPDTTHQDIMDLFDRAIAIAEGI